MYSMVTEPMWNLGVLYDLTHYLETIKWTASVWITLMTD